MYCACTHFPPDLTHGWWSITNLSSIEKLLRSFCLRGYREKTLFKALQKNKETISRIFDSSYLQECSESFNALISQLNSELKSNEIVTEDSSEKMEVDEMKEEVEKKKNVDGDGANEEGKVKDEVQQKDMELAGGNSHSTSSGNQNEIPKKDEKSDSEDSSDSDSTSSSSSSNARSSQEDDEVTKTTKTQLPLSPSKTENNSIFAQTAISLKPVHKIPQSGVFNPTFVELSEQFALKVLEYMEGVESRLFVAQLQQEVCLYVTQDYMEFLYQGTWETVLYIEVVLNSKVIVEWNLSIKDTLGPW